MAGAGYKLFNTGDVLTAAQVNTYLQEQAVMRFASATARTTALSGVLAEGMVSYLMDTNAVEVYDGSAWVGVATGDITAVTAGTGISGGGTSGAVTITNSMATEITAAGDIIVGTGSGTFDNLPIGTTGQVLTADTTVSPYKVKWAAAGGGAASYVGVGLSMTAQSQSITNQTYTALTFGAGSEEWDTDGFHDTTTNNTRITIPTGKGGKYAINGLVFFNSTVTTSIQLVIYKNGSVLPGSTRGYLSYVQAANSEYASGGTTINLAAGDYIELYVYANSNGNEVVYDKYFIATYLGA